MRFLALMTAIAAWTYGLGSTTTGVEQDTMAGGGAVTINATGGRCGQGSMKIKNMTSGTRSGSSFRHSNTSTGDYQVKFDIWYVTAPNVLTTIFCHHANISLSADSGPQASLKLTTTGKLQIFQTSATQVGSDSAALVPGWNRIEVLIQTSAANGSNRIAAKLNGTTFADDSTLSLSTTSLAIRLGGNMLGETCTTGEWEISDVAIFNASGGTENSWVGDRVVAILRPASAGDYNEGTDTGATGWDTVDERPPDDVTTYHTIVTASASSTAADRLDVRLTPWTWGIKSGTNAIVFGNFRGMPASNASCNFILRVKTVALSTSITESSAKAVTGTAWVTNDDTAGTKQPPLVVRLNPETAAAFTAAALNTMQLGTRSSDTTPNARTTALWANVLFTPASLPPVVRPMRFYRRMA